MSIARQFLTLVLSASPPEAGSTFPKSITVTATPRNAAHVVVSRSVTWQVSDPLVASVTPLSDRVARITALTPGECNVTATVDGVTSTPLHIVSH